MCLSQVLFCGVMNEQEPLNDYNRRTIRMRYAWLSNRNTRPMLIVWVLFVSVSLLGLSQCGKPLPSDVHVMSLRCEYLVDPLGIDADAPRMSWILDSVTRGQGQTAYRILAAGSKEKLGADHGDLWDSGRVESNATAQIIYTGAPLQSRQNVWWKVRVWDINGQPSEWSAPAHWSMGLLRKMDWQALWIGHDTDDLNEDPELHLPPAPFLRKSFTLGKPVQSAVIYGTAQGLFELRLNGKRVSNEVFMPGWSDYNTRLYYGTWDVTDQVQEGKNAIGAMLANGWYAGYIGFGLLHARRDKNVTKTSGRAYYGDRPSLMAQLEVTYTDGTSEIIVTDQDWKGSDGSIRYADFLMGEGYDARLEQDGWDTPAFDDTGWEPVELMEGAKGAIEAFPGDPVRRTDKLTAIEITEPTPGAYVYNMGQNFGGRVKLKVQGEAGTVVVLRFAEMLNADGTIMTENLRAARTTDTYILKGGGIETWEPKFTFHGFQYVEVTGYPGIPTMDAITGIALNSDTPVTGSFECSSDMVNQLYSNITWTQRANFIDVPTDCPQRDERLGWTGDAQAYVRSATYNMDIGAFYTKWLAVLNDDQWDDGAYTDYAPNHGMAKRDDSPGWADAGIVCPWTIWKVYGDTQVIERYWDNMQRFIAYQERTSKNYIRDPKRAYGDWLSIPEKTTPNDYLATAYFGYSTKLMAEMADVIGRTEDAAAYRAKFDKIKSAFAKKYITPEGFLTVNTQTAYAMALYMDLLPENMQRPAGDKLAALIQENNGVLSTGFLGLEPLLPALTANGHTDVAYQLLTNTAYPSWGYSVVNGATSIWERWNGYTIENGFANPGMNSFSHYAYGAGCEWMFADMAGIDTDGPGFRNLRVQPRIINDKISWTKASYNSINGLISTSWNNSGPVIALDVTIPVNTTATVYVPAESLADVQEGAGPAKDADGVEFLRLEHGDAVFAVGSGTYRFSAKKN
jgi:alpha-L-rhamnosidase